MPRINRTSLRHFVRHYVEMVIAMFAGMAVLGIPAVAALGALGSSTSDLRADAPAILLLGMATTMTVPMVAWMRFRGHAWPASMEMAASMFIPTFAAVGLLAAGLLTDMGGLMTIQHAAMFPAMLVAMLLRVEEYSGGCVSPSAAASPRRQRHA
jgi:hypothetical protein